MSRWKAIRLQRFDDLEDIFPILELECRSCSHVVRVTGAWSFQLACEVCVAQVRFKRSVLVDYGLVTLWKNELTGLGERAYFSISDSISCFQPGRRYTFEWM